MNQKRIRLAEHQHLGENMYNIFRIIMRKRFEVRIKFVLGLGVCIHNKDSIAIVYRFTKVRISPRWHVPSNPTVTRNSISAFPLGISGFQVPASVIERQAYILNSTMTKRGTTKRVHAIGARVP